MQAVAAMADVTVIAPIGLVTYSRIGMVQPGGRETPQERRDGRLEIIYPRWLYPPGGTGFTPFFLAAQLVRTVGRLRRRFPFQVIDSHFGYPDGIAACVLAIIFRTPFIITLRGNETMHAQGPVVRWLLGWALRRAARVITVSERLREFAISLGARPWYTRTIPNGIDTTVFYPKDRAELRQKYGIPWESKVILSAGALIERKGHHRIARALKVLKQEGLLTRLLIAGGPGPEGHYEGNIRRMVAESGLEEDVHFLGQVHPSTLAELMSVADVLCLASTREGWPNVVHEALGCGTPVVATDVGGIPDMLPGSRYGFVVPVDDQIALENALRQALQKQWDRGEICAWGQSRSWDKVAQEVLQTINSAISE
jgi:glycosyltransferase involved in cell wall biosynthesis